MSIGRLVLRGTPVKGRSFSCNKRVFAVRCVVVPRINRASGKTAMFVNRPSQFWQSTAVLGRKDEPVPVGYHTGRVEAHAGRRLETDKTTGQKYYTGPLHITRATGSRLLDEKPETHHDFRARYHNGSVVATV
jgi:hypothetical protein